MGYLMHQYIKKRIRKALLLHAYHVPLFHLMENTYMVVIRKARSDDVGTIIDLVNFYANKELLLRKSAFKVYKTLQNFFVAEEEGRIVGCAALVVLWKNLAEICSLAVDTLYAKRGIGSGLVFECIKQARELNVNQVIALTYQDHFFESLGFHTVEKENYPRKLMWECLECPRFEKCDERAYLKDLEDSDL
jgi:amino-acid N-acetyltransferase